VKIYNLKYIHINQS